MTISIKHNLAFVTEVDESHPIAKRLLSLSNEQQVEFLEGMLKELIAPVIQPTLQDINDGGSWAILKVVA
jgi:hypothetical protein